MSIRTVTVFGGTGFLGRRIVRHLRAREFCIRVASRHPDRADELFPALHEIHKIEAEIHDRQSVADALAGAYAAVNAVSLYVERGAETFQSVHVESARRVADEARRGGVERLVHVSGIGADIGSSSLYVRKRGEGEAAVRDTFADAIIMRPAVMFGPDDAFLTVILRLLRRLPVFPMFGRGRTRLQPAYVEDVGEAVAKALQQKEPCSACYELGGPRVYSYQHLLRLIAGEAGIKPILLPVPFVAWHTLGMLAEMLPSPAVTRNQVELMQIDSITAAGVPGFENLGISPHTLEEILQRILSTSAR